MAMNDQIREIIDMDRHASNIASEAREKAEAINKETGQIIKSQREEVLKSTRETCRQNYDIKVQEAETEKNRIIAEMNNELNCIREAYQANKQEWAHKILDELLNKVSIHHV